MRGTVKKKPKISKKQQEVSSTNFFYKTNGFFERNQKIFLIISMLSGALM
jgi:hypothetical protein